MDQHQRSRSKSQTPYWLRIRNADTNMISTRAWRWTISMMHLPLISTIISPCEPRWMLPYPFEYIPIWFLAVFPFAPFNYSSAGMSWRQRELKNTSIHVLIISWSWPMTLRNRILYLYSPTYSSIPMLFLFHDRVFSHRITHCWYSRIFRSQILPDIDPFPISESLRCSQSS